MKANMGNSDRIIRILLAIVMVMAILLGWISGFLAVIAGLLAVVFVATSVIRFCPLYQPLGLRTDKKSG